MAYKILCIVEEYLRSLLYSWESEVCNPTLDQIHDFVERIDSHGGVL